MNRFRTLLADILVGLALVLVLWWVLRRVFGLLLWLVNAVAFIAVIVLLLWVAGRLRRK
jgi:hypothetical protein